MWNYPCTVSYTHLFFLTLTDPDTLYLQEHYETDGAPAVRTAVYQRVDAFLPETLQTALYEEPSDCLTFYWPNPVSYTHLRIQFHFFQNDCWRMTVTDNGIPPAGPIREGGGISGMRRRVRQLGGRMELYTCLLYTSGGQIHRDHVHQPDHLRPLLPGYRRND